MRKWFVSRHACAVEWMRNMGIGIDHWVPHLDVRELKCGDTVIGTLPLPQVAALQRCGATYWHLALDLPAAMRGTELSVEGMHRYGARLECYKVELAGTWPQ